MYPAEHYLTALPQKKIFGRTTKYIDHHDLMPDLYKDLEMTELDRRQADYTGTQNDPNHPNNAAHDYNLHSRRVYRLK